MRHKILVINSGSSSLKYRLFVMDDPPRTLAQGLVERIGETAPAASSPPVTDHRAAIEAMMLQLDESGSSGTEGLHAVGHRVVHGGTTFSSAVIVDESVTAGIRAAAPLAPLHNPANLLGIEGCSRLWPGVPQVAVFDTAFHRSLAPEAFRYAIPGDDVRIRRYGFHGTSFSGMVRQVAERLKRPRETLNLIALHLGNGASICAIRGGKSIDTSMGMTPLAGLVMGTRCGDLDPGVVLFWLSQAGETSQQVAEKLNRESGLKGIAGTNDMREILAGLREGRAASQLAFDMYVHRIRHYIGAYRAQLPELDALVFSGGVGEHAAIVRAAVCRDLGHLGLVLDEAANQAVGQCEIQAADSAASILVVPADEELEIALQTQELLGAAFEVP